PEGRAPRGSADALATFAGSAAVLGPCACPPSGAARGDWALGRARRKKRRRASPKRERGAGAPQENSHEGTVVEGTPERGQAPRGRLAGSARQEGMGRAAVGERGAAPRARARHGGARQAHPERSEVSLPWTADGPRRR